MQGKVSQGFSVGEGGVVWGRKEKYNLLFSSPSSFLSHIPFNGTVRLPGSTAQPQAHCDDCQHWPVHMNLFPSHQENEEG